jgi:hypothetical protein
MKRFKNLEWRASLRPADFLGAHHSRCGPGPKSSALMRRESKVNIAKPGRFLKRFMKTGRAMLTATEGTSVVETSTSIDWNSPDRRS